MHPTPDQPGPNQESVWAYPQPGGFYGGWITSRVAGPFKGGPGSQFW